MFAKSHIAQMVAWDELYTAFEPAGVVCFLAWIALQIPSNDIALPMQIPIVLRIKVCIYFARGMIANDKTEMMGTR
jgi:hypothetical protein